MSAFVDQAGIEIKAGSGGAGLASFRREKHVPRGGPNGGDGGDGGSVIFVGNHNLGTLLNYQYARFHNAEDGANGGQNKKTGKSGADLILEAPVGSVITDLETGETLADLDEDGKSFTAAIGGKGGWGNARFKTSTNRSPRRHGKGLPGQERKIKLELKLIADVGVVGYPNAGKSTFVSRVSNARPKIGAYPFTTITPNLGVVAWDEFKSFYIADVPGVIEGAAEGKGLGHRFLQHLERTRLLVHMIDPTQIAEDRCPVRDYHALNRELEKFSEDLAKKPQFIVVNKMDAVTDEKVRAKLTDELRTATGEKLFFISSVTGEGVELLKKKLGQRLESIRNRENPQTTKSPVSV